MYEKTTEKKPCENCALAKQNGQPHLISALFSKLWQKSPTKLGAAVCALVVLHFAAQFVFFQNEKKTAQIENAPSFEIQTETKPAEEIKLPIIGTQPAKVRETESAVPAIRKTSVPVRKKEPPRETDAQRLRRAERILTGA